jgi:hypothetical protein
MSSPINTTSPPPRPARSPLRPRTRSLASVGSPTDSEATSPTGSMESFVLVCAGRNLQGSFEAPTYSLNGLTKVEDSYTNHGLELSSVSEIGLSRLDEVSYFSNEQVINSGLGDQSATARENETTWTTVNEKINKPHSFESVSSSSSDEAMTPFSSPIGLYNAMDETKPEIRHIEFGCSFNEIEIAKALESKRSALKKYDFSSSTTDCRASWTRSRSSLSTSNAGPPSPRPMSVSSQPRSPISREISFCTDAISQMNLKRTTKTSRASLTIAIPTVAQTPKRTEMTRSFHLVPELQTIVPPRRASHPSIELPSRPSFIRTRSGMTCVEGMQPLFSPSLRPLVMYSGLTAVMGGSNHNKTAGYFTSTLQAAPKGPTPPSLLRRGSTEKVVSLSVPISPIKPTQSASPTESTSTSSSWMTILNNSLELSPRPGTPRPDECKASLSFTAQGDKTFNPYFMEASMFEEGS